MFSGIIESVGILRASTMREGLLCLEVLAPDIAREVKIGESIAVNGACLTLARKRPEILIFEAMPQTVKDTNLGRLAVGDKLNLERALKMGDRISGHFVTGHVDCVGVIRKRGFREGNLAFEIAAPAEFLRYALLKGCVAVDGISLTIQGKRQGAFLVYIIPHTLKNTALDARQASERVNLEFDLLLKKSAIPA